MVAGLGLGLAEARLAVGCSRAERARETGLVGAVALARHAAVFARAGRDADALVGAVGEPAIGVAAASGADERTDGSGLVQQRAGEDVATIGALVLAVVVVERTGLVVRADDAGEVARVPRGEQDAFTSGGALDGGLRGVVDVDELVADLVEFGEHADGEVGVDAVARLVGRAHLAADGVDHLDDVLALHAVAAVRDGATGEHPLVVADARVVDARDGAVEGDAAAGVVGREREAAPGRLVGGRRIEADGETVVRAGRGGRLAGRGIFRAGRDGVHDGDPGAIALDGRLDVERQRRVEALRQEAGEADGVRLERGVDRRLLEGGEHAVVDPLRRLLAVLLGVLEVVLARVGIGGSRGRGSLFFGAADEGGAGGERHGEQREESEATNEQVLHEASFPSGKRTNVGTCTTRPLMTRRIRTQPRRNVSPDCIGAKEGRGSQAP